MFYRIGDYLLNLNVVSSFHIFQQNMSSQATLYASDGGVDKPVFTGTREDAEAKLADIQAVIRTNGCYIGGIEVEEVVEVALEPEPEEVVESEDDATDEEE